jgi:glutathione S-transferase
MPKPILYGPTYSSHVRVIRLCLAEKNVAYEMRDVDLLRGASRKPEHRKLHPFGKVPVLQHDGHTIYETSAIARYVDAAFPGPALQPKDAVEAARMNQIVAVLETYLHPLMIGQVVMQYVRKRYLDRAINRGAIQKAMPQIRDGLTALEALIGSGEFVVGKSVTLADLVLGAFLAPFVQTPEGKRTLPKFAKLSAWWDGFSHRPSMTATVPQL